MNGGTPAKAVGRKQNIIMASVMNKILVFINFCFVMEFLPFLYKCLEKPIEIDQN